MMGARREFYIWKDNKCAKNCSDSYYYMKTR